ncbi:GD17150 [Drosophila simulans]|uniref:GD17150 n=1 Tax=Drosophila simulans TaxID=7240 RepID=B4R4L3_DROSI|nr:GD17150 [Drosophila simulans]
MATWVGGMEGLLLVGNPYVRFAVSSIIYFGFVPLDTEDGGMLVRRWSIGSIGNTQDKAQYGVRVATLES